MGLGLCFGLVGEVSVVGGDEGIRSRQKKPFSHQHGRVREFGSIFLGFGGALDEG